MIPRMMMIMMMIMMLKMIRMMMMLRMILVPYPATASFVNCCGAKSLRMLR